MSAKSVGVCLALLCLSQAAFAQELKSSHRPAPRREAAASRETIDASMARLAVKATFQPSAQPTQRELLGVILLMSLRQQHGSRT